MPGHRTHAYIDWELFQKSYWRLHRNVDMPYLFLGRKHRVFFHDGASTIAIARQLYPNDPLAEQAAIVHCQLDTLCTADPLFKKQLDFLANLDARKRREAKKTGAQRKKTKSSKKTLCRDPFEDFDAFLKKAQEIQQMSKML